MTGGNSTKRLTNEFFLEACNSLPNSFNYDFSGTNYRNVRTEVSIICKLHGEFESGPQSIINGHGCHICDKLSNRFPSSTLTIDQYKIFASILHENKYDYSMITTLNFNDRKIPIICSIHGIFKARKSAHISPKQLYGCQKCNKGFSKYEEQIEKFLIKYGIEYVRQKEFDGLVSQHGKPIYFDFYIPNEKLLIEYDGEHHLKKVKFNSNQSDEIQERRLKEIQIKDGLKNNYINLVRIYFTRSKDINSILVEEVLGFQLKHDKEFDSPFIQNMVDDRGNKIGGEVIFYY